MQVGRRLLAAGALALAAAPWSALPAFAATSAQPAATAPETYSRPTDGVFEVAGHGWGHGHGMSQYGAQGAAAKKSLSGPQITGFYYPHTTAVTLANAPIRVRVSCDTGATACAGVSVSAANGVLLTDRGAASPTAVALPKDRARWRVTVDAAGFHLLGLVGNTWSAYPNAGTVYAGPVELASATGTSAPVMRLLYSASTGVVWREYRGALRVVRSTTSQTAARLVNVLGMEDYLLGVVPRESISSWPTQALVAQAIAARSYAAYERAHVPSGQAWDICDTTMCQVYGGYALGTRASDGTTSTTALEPASTTKAVHCDSAHYPDPTDPCSTNPGPVVRTYSGSPIFAQFSASNGGWSTATTSSDPAVQAYLVAQEDPYDGLTNSTVHSWSAKLPVSSLERAYPQLGTFVQMQVTARDGNGDWGGRVKSVVLRGKSSTGAATSVTVTGSAIYSLRSWPAASDGLRSTWFKPADGAPTVTGPSQAARGSVVALAGTSAAGTSSVTVWFRRQGSTSWASRTATPAADGSWSMSYTATVDYDYYAAVGALHSPIRTTTAVGTTIIAPSSVPAGTVVKVRGLAAPGWRVDVCWLGSQSTCAYHSYLTADRNGWWYVSKRFDVTTRYWARAAQKSSPVMTTTVT